MDEEEAGIDQPGRATHCAISMHLSDEGSELQGLDKTFVVDEVIRGSDKKEEDDTGAGQEDREDQTGKGESFPVFAQVENVGQEDRDEQEDRGIFGGGAQAGQGTGPEVVSQLPGSQYPDDEDV